MATITTPGGSDIVELSNPQNEAIRSKWCLNALKWKICAKTTAIVGWLALSMSVMAKNQDEIDTTQVNSWEIPELVVWNTFEWNTNEKSIREYFLRRWESPITMEWVQIEEVHYNHDSDQTIEDTKVLVNKTEVFWKPDFNSGNISSRLEKLAKEMNERHGSQYKELDWEKRMKDVNPNDDESSMLNNILSSMPEQVDELETWQLMTAFLWLDRALSDNKFANFLRLDNIFRIVKNINPKAIDTAYKITLPDNMGNKQYMSVNPTLKIVSNVNEFLNRKIWSNEISDYEEAYAQIVEEGKKEVEESFVKKYSEKGKSEKWLNNILHYFVNINTHFDVKDLKKVHNIFYPKNIWWDTKAPNWQLYLKEYKSWFIREHREFVTVNNNNYEYFHPREIESSLKNLILWYKQDKDTSIFLKAIVFYIIFCEIHPFYNWNWTIWLLFTDFILKTNGYDFEVIDFLDKVVNLEL